MTITDECWCEEEAKKLLNGTIDIPTITEFLLQFQRDVERQYQWWIDHAKDVENGSIRV